MSNIYHVWRPIEDLPDNFMALANEKFHKISQDWLNARNKIKGPVFQVFLEKLNREWAIEIGQVENLYFLSDGISKTLIEHGLQSVDLSHQNGGIEIIDPALFLQSHNDILNGIYEDVRSRTPISKYMIRCMHAMFTEFQDYCPGVDPLGRRVRVQLRKGFFKIFPNNPVRPDGLIHEYCPPPHVDSEIDNLLRMHDEHVAKSVPVDVEAAWFHHRFVQIHPFQDGNGRMARSLASLIYIKAGYLPPVVTLKGKPDYLKALDIANQGDLKPFVDCLASLVVKRTKQCFRLFREAKDQLAGKPSSASRFRPR
jgi:hypothetical protein